MKKVLSFLLAIMVCFTCGISAFAANSPTPDRYYTVDAMMVLKDKYNVELPICEAVWKCLYDGADVKEAVTMLFTRALKEEI